jgi:hypothetical protein
MAKGGITTGEWSGSDATDALHRTIKEHQETTNRQTAKIIRLTWVLTFLTLVMTVAVFFQIYLTLR